MAACIVVTQCQPHQHSSKQHYSTLLQGATQGNRCLFSAVRFVTSPAQNDTKKLAEAKQLVYLKGFTDGVLIVGEYAGKKVSKHAAILHSSRSCACLRGSWQKRVWQYGSANFITFLWSDGQQD